MSNTHEPMPTLNSSTAIWVLVLEEVPHLFPLATQGEVVAELRADMHQRDEMGRAKYGTALQPHNGRNPLVDAYQEALDLTVYLRQAMEETLDEYAWLHERYVRALTMAYDLKRRLMISEGWQP